MNNEYLKELENNGKYEECAKGYIEEYNSGGEDWYAVKAGELFFKAGKLKEATSSYDMVFESNLEILHKKAFDFYFETKQFKKASDHFEDNTSNLTKTKMMMFADRLFDAGAFKEAEVWYRNAITDTKQESSFHFTKFSFDDFSEFNEGQVKKIHYAYDLFENRDYKKALALLKKYRLNKSAYIKMAECYFMQKEFEKAEEIYRDIVQRTNDSYCMYMLGVCYDNEDLDVNSFENAFYWYQYAEEQGSEYPYYNLGVCYQFGRGTEENKEKAEEMFLKGVEKNIDSEKCLCKLGFLAYRENNKELALKYYSEAVKKKSALALVNAAVCYFEDKIYFCSEDEILCYLAKSAALGNRQALLMLESYDAVNSSDE